MRIGIFDSGLGGLFILKSLQRHLPKYDYLYLGDTQNLPYGDKSQKQIFELTKRAVRYLFAHGSELVIVACNTSSSQALRKIQQEWLPKSKYRHRRVLGVIRPTIEELVKFKSIGVIGTRRTIDSDAYWRELEHAGWRGILVAKATPKLVPMIEANSLDLDLLEDYVRPFKKSQALILACTHYAIIKRPIQKILGRKVRIISQDDLLPQKLRGYLSRHSEISRRLSKGGKISLVVTKLNPHYRNLAKQWFGPAVKLRVVTI